MHRFLAASVLAGVTALAAPPDGAFSSENLEFFERRVRPVLVEQCYPCHSSQSDKLKAGLHLDSREGALKGGESGPAIVPGDPEASLLIKAIRYSDKDLQMPPRKGKLPDAQVVDLTTWVRLGAPWPQEAQVQAHATGKSFEITDRDRAYWAFQPIRQPALPQVQHRDWVRNGIDAFVLAELEAKEIVPNPPAAQRELVRRVYFDLLGLPPNPAEVEAFINDASPGAYEALIDRLLSRPEYGERWARHWLDIVRYAQSNGYERDGEKPFAWRYRDYVITAFNEDKPYDRFVQEQIAGDELPDATADSVVATGFQRLGVWDDEPDDAVLAQYDGLDDIVSTTSTAFLGLTLGCARCHDHKFDPISQSDYYSFLAFFRNIRPNEDARYTLDSANYVPMAPAPKVQEWANRHEAQVQGVESELACAIEGPEKAALQRQLQHLRDEPPPFEWALAVRESGPKPLPTHLLIRGNPKSPGPEVEPAFLTVLGGGKPGLAPRPRGASSTGRRLALARWIASSENPLTARVAVNRIWHYHFGQGLVKTTGDFGHAGQPPTHPQLLDWLAADFIHSSWSLKRLHRLILLSNTYRMSSQSPNERALATDPGDDLLWRQRLRRLDAEGIRDSVLAVSGELNPAMGGRGFFPRLEGEVLAGESRPGLDWELSGPADQARRSIYIYLRRTMLVPLLEAFDYSNTSSPLGERPVTTVAPQALMLLNGEWAQQRAQAFAARLIREGGSDSSCRVKRAYELAFGRSPTPRETEIAQRFLVTQAKDSLTIRSRLDFRVDVPASLFQDYMKQLQPGDFLHGPREGWTYYRGRWSGAYEGIRTMDRQRGPFALWNGLSSENATVETTLYLPRSSESASLLLRSRAEADEYRGYEVSFDPRQQRISLRRHSKEIETVAESPARIPAGEPLFVRVELAGPRVRVWTAGGSGRANPSGDSAKSNSVRGARREVQLVLDATDPKPIQGTGSFGVRCSGAALSLDGLTLQTEQGTRSIAPQGAGGSDGHPMLSQVDSPPDSWTERRAWQSFCLLLLNLNEFVYVE